MYTKSSLVILLLSVMKITFFYKVGAVAEPTGAYNKEIIITDAVRRIKRDGYPVQVHSVQTVDGFTLTLHRISYSSDTWRPVVFLMIGIYASSDAWLLNGPEISLPYLLVNNGYDVWLGNNRGTIYSREHINLTPDDRMYWNFSFHELAVYDMPAMVNYILNATNQTGMHFVGISQGATIFLVLNAMFPEYNCKFISAHLLAPVAFLNNMKGPLGKMLSPLLGTRNYLSSWLEGREMISTGRYVKRLLSTGCLKNEYDRACVVRVWTSLGYDIRGLNTSLMSDVMANFPVGGSVNQLLHYLQNYNSGKFRQYDYGLLGNLLTYNQTWPPDYELRKVTTPTYMYISENDYFVSVKDVQRLVKRLANVQGIYKISWKHWNHFDFICGLRVKEYVFDKIVRDINIYKHRSRAKD